MHSLSGVATSGDGCANPLGEHEPMEVDGPRIKLKLDCGRRIWTYSALISDAYHNAQIFSPSPEVNERHLQNAERDANKHFGDWPLLKILPKMNTDNRGRPVLPRVRVIALFTSLPIDRRFMLSSLLVVWYQDAIWPIVSHEVEEHFTAIDWDNLAADYDE